MFLGKSVKVHMNFTNTNPRPADLKRLRDALITEAEKTRACIRIGNGARTNKRPALNNAQFAVQGNNWLAIGQNQSQPFKNDLKDIIELSRASAAIGIP